MSQSSKRKNDSVVETFKDIIPLTFGEEIGNAASHGAAALLTLFILHMQQCIVLTMVAH